MQGVAPEFAVTALVTADVYDRQEDIVGGCDKVWHSGVNVVRRYLIVARIDLHSLKIDELIKIRCEQKNRDGDNVVFGVNNACLCRFRECAIYSAYPNTGSSRGSG